MRIVPAIEAMRREPGLQRRAQADMIATGERWRDVPEVRPLLADLERFGAGAPLKACAVLANAFANAGRAIALAASLCREFTPALERRPMGQLPFRHGFDGAVSTLLLAHSGRAHLVLHAREPGEWHFATAGFGDALRHEVVLAGHAEARFVRRDDPAGEFAIESLPLRPGTRVALDMARETLQVGRVERRLVTLRLHRFAAEPAPSREYRLADGTLMHQAAGDIRTSRHEMMLTVLGRMERPDAAPLMAAMALEPGDSSLRWHALRECLALDTAVGFGGLSAIAEAERDSLAAPAGALRAQLVEAHPELAALAEARCPA